MNRIERLSAILIQLQSKRIVRASEIAKRFDISLRTVYRDIRALEESGVPIGAEAGLGYFLMEGYRLPPVLFTTEEAGAMLFGSKFVKSMTPVGTGAAYESALMKIRSTLQSTDKDYLEKLEKSIVIQSSPLQQNHKVLSETMQAIQNSITGSKQLKIVYHSNYNNSRNKRIIEPLGMIYYMDNWHVIAYCQLRKDYRDFRSDRISSIRLLNSKFAHISQKSLEEYIRDSRKKSLINEISVTMDVKLADQIRSFKNYFGFHSQIKSGESITMTFLSPELNYFSKWLVSLGPEVEINYPEALKEKVVHLIEQFANKYLKTTVFK